MNIIQRLLFFCTYLGTLGILLTSCTSYRIPRMQQKVAVKSIHKDINKIEKKLFKMHPDIDLYISKKDLHQSFSTLRQSIDSPMTPQQLYPLVAPIIASIRQGHTTIIPMIRNNSFSMSKRLSTTLLPMQQMKVVEENNRFYIVSDRTKDTSLIVGAEILKINNSTPQGIADSFQQIFLGDGYNESYYQQARMNNLGDMYNRLYGHTEKLTLTLRNVDSVFTKTLQSYSSKIINNRNKALKHKVNALIKDIEKDTSLTDVQRSIIIDSLKAIVQPEGQWHYGWNVKMAYYSKELKLLDSITALLTIRDFYTESPILYKMTYASIFDKLKTLGVQHLILDLRDNPGGSVAEIEVLHGYITDREIYHTAQPSMRVRSNYKIPLWMMQQSKWYLYPIIVPIVLNRSIDYIENTRLRSGSIHDYYNKHGEAKTRANNAFDGHMYMLINGTTFSAASIVAANFKSEQRGVILGKESGGTYNGTVAGQMPIIPLKRIGMNMRVGTMNIIPEHPYGEHGRGVVPHYEISNTLQDYLQGIDVPVELIRAYIQRASTNTSSVTYQGE